MCLGGINVWKKKIIKNCSYFILISILFYSGITFLKNYKIQAQQTYNYNLIFITLVTIVFFGGIGALLKLSNTDFSIRKIKLLKVDALKLLVLGLPSFIISMTYIWAYLGLFNRFPLFLSYIPEIENIIIVSSIIFGHTVTSSIYTD